MFKLEIKTTNAAFSDGNTAGEVARLLRQAAEAIENGADRRPLSDYNGNKCGYFAFTGKSDPRQRGLWG